jgi:hypothetical protein
MAVVFYHGGWCLRQQVNLNCNPNKEQWIDLSSVVRKVREKFSHAVITLLKNCVSSQKARF